MKFKMLFAVIATFLALTVSIATATPVYNLGLPCGPGMSVCEYNYTVSFPALVTYDGGNSSTFSPGATSQYVWSSQTVMESGYWAGAASNGNGSWWQAISGYSTSTVNFETWSDYFSYGCCEPDWWDDIVTINKNKTVSSSGWVESIISDGTTITHMYTTWGNSTDTWDTYSRQSGASYYTGGSYSYNNESRSDGVYFSEPWSTYFEERYPANPSTATPEPSALVLSLGGV